MLAPNLTPACTGIASWSVRPSASIGCGEGGRRCEKRGGYAGIASWSVRPRRTLESSTEGQRIARPSLGVTVSPVPPTRGKCVSPEGLAGTLVTAGGCMKKVSTRGRLRGGGYAAVTRRLRRTSRLDGVQVHEEGEHSGALRRPHRRVLVVVAAVELAGLVPARCEIKCGYARWRR